MDVRPVKRQDFDAYRDILARTSEEDRYCRFLHAVSAVDADEIQRFVTPDPGVVGIIAFEAGKPLGAAHAFMLDDGAAELAIVVASDARRGGAGHALVGALLDALVARGCSRLIAYAFADNIAMTHLARDFGMTLAGIDANVACWSVDLSQRIAA